MWFLSLLYHDLEEEGGQLFARNVRYESTENYAKVCFIFYKCVSLLLVQAENAGFYLAQNKQSGDYIRESVPECVHIRIRDSFV